MNAKEGYIVRLLEGGDKKFIIPVYQRAYNWKLANCELLFEDLMDVYQNDLKSHFFGSIVFVDNDIGGSHEYIIIDGQQRLITVSLLLLAIRNYAVANKITSHQIIPDKITESFLTDKYAEGDKKLKLKLIQGDDEAYDRLIDRNEPIVGTGITINYEYFYNKLADLTLDELEGIYDAIRKLMIVNISLEPYKGDDPQLIFESLNSTGMALDESDKIRNYVLMKLEPKRQEKVYNNYWAELEKLIDKDEFSKFVRYYLAVKTRALPDEKKLYFTFKTYREQDVEDLTIENLLSDMLVYANYYCIIKQAKENDTGYMARIARFNKLEVNTAIPLLFDFFKAKDDALLTDDTLNEAISIIENYIARRMVCGLPTSMLNKAFIYIGDEIDKYIKKDGATYIDALKYAILSKTGKTRFPNDHDFAEKFPLYELYNAKSSARKYFFERLENHKSKERVAVAEQVEKGQLTIEHIMPQTLSKEWQKYLGPDYELIHAKYIDTIGNLTLTAYNSDYSNLMFERKRDMQDKGFACSKLMLNSYLADCTEWREEQIKERAQILLNWALNIWPAPVTKFKPKVIENWVGLDDEYDFTNKVISKIILMGDEISADNITDAYKKIMDILYMLDPLKFTSKELSFVSSKMEQLRSPYELSKATYIETNLSSQGKISALRDIFKLFEIDSSELAFLVRPKDGDSSLFNIEDESTYYSVTAGALARALISKLLQEGKISEIELAEMLTKDFTKQFKRVVYPIVALRRDANRGTSKKYRYCKNPVKYNGKDIYISSEWFDESKDDLIKWYKSHYQEDK